MDWLSFPVQMMFWFFIKYHVPTNTQPVADLQPAGDIEAILAWGAAPSCVV